ncbi:MAG: hypothetical protein N0E40_21505 [Candidatus Thiodiazotropha taylori]|nr:hypothetical protein [Candidatus Thiodiazotropha taylori]MCG8030525.1 hypothetical protein [Candidatus Thiodiazotropha taylori]MCW4248148.1 hypothetical protein [Candidatus Thiodiazotropha endolucinida]MCW4306554.1 hypothetical protein [Candidatus Thiodiazotropha taylori]
MSKKILLVVLLFPSILCAGQEELAPAIKEARSEREVEENSALVFERVLEAERRGLLSPETQAILDEARRKGIVGAPLPQRGDCYIVGYQKGYSAKHYKNNYEPFPDKVSVTVKVRVAGDRSETSSSDRDASASRCREIASNTIFCVAGSMRVSDIVAVYPTEGKVITTTVYPEHHPFAGASLLVGDILSRCN